jgi:Protein kinase domain
MTAGPTGQWRQPPAHQPLEPADPVEIGGYRLRARLGAGGMGHVYLSYTPGGRPVAVKVVRAEYAADPAFRKRFEREVLTARKVQGPFTAPVVDADPLAAQPWLATAYVPGPSLQHAVGSYGPLPLESVLVLVAGVAEALQSLHAAGVVHRDLKPSNVMLAADGPRVIDFGIARAVDSTSMTQTGTRLGTPAFMAPEQIRGEPATPALDVFALGGVACFAASGELPFGGGLDPAVPYRILEQEPDLAAVPGPVREIVARCLAKQPRHRPTPTQVMELCRTASTGTRLRMGEGWLPPVVAAAVSRIANAPVPKARRRPVRRGRVALASALLAAALASAVTFLAVHGHADAGGARAGGPQTGATRSGAPQNGATQSGTAPAQGAPAETSAPVTAGDPASEAPSVIGHATLGLSDGIGVDVGTLPLQLTDNTLATSFWLSDGTLNSGSLPGGVGSVSLWPEDTAPTADQCATQLRTQAVGALTARAGRWFCAAGFGFPRKVAAAHILSVTTARVQVEVTVWSTELT